MPKSTQITLLASIAIGAVLIVLLAFVARPSEEVNLPIKIEVFSNVECSACQAYYDTFIALKDNFSEDEVEFTFYDSYYSDDGYNSLLAIQAAKAQGKYWEYLKKVYDAVGELREDNLKQFARNLELNMAQFEEDRNNNAELQNIVQIEIDTFIERGVEYTPTLYINGRQVNERNQDNLIELVQEKIDAAKQQQEE
jgi:protein-disulfide isomerase